MKKTEFIESITPMMHQFLYRHFPTYSHDDLFQECVIIALEQEQKFDPSKGAKLSSWIFEQIKGRIPKYIKKNMLGISVPHNITPDWSFGDIDKMEDLACEEFGKKETLKARELREYEEDKILRKARRTVEKNLNSKKAIPSKEYSNVMNKILEGESLVNISAHYNKKRDWAKTKLKTIENRLVGFHS